MGRTGRATIGRTGLAAVVAAVLAVVALAWAETSPGHHHDRHPIVVQMGVAPTSSRASGPVATTVP